MRFRTRLSTWWIERSTIESRITSGFFLAAFFALLVAAVAIYYLHSAGDRFSEIAERDRLMETAALRLEVAVEKQSDGVRGFLLSGDDTLLDPYYRGSELFARNFVQLEESEKTADGRLLLAEIKDLHGQFEERAMQEIELRRAGWPQVAAGRWQSGGKQDLESMVQKLEELASRQGEVVLGDLKRSVGERRTAQTLSLILVVFAFATSIVAGLRTSRRITGPINILIEATEKIKSGNLSTIVSIPAPVELARLADSVNDMATNLEESRQTLEASMVEISRKNVELSVLNGLASTISQSLDLEEILDDSLEKVMQVLNADAGAIHLLDRRKGLLNAVLHRGFSQECVAEFSHLELGRELIGRAALSGNVKTIRSVEADHRITNAIIKNEGYQSYVCFPLKSKGEVLGVMSIAARNVLAFRSEQEQLLASVSGHIGVAVENSLLFRESARRAQEALALYRVAQTISSTLDSTQVLHLVVEEMSKLVGVQRCALFFYDAERDLLQGQVSVGLDTSDIRDVVRLASSNPVFSQVISSRQPIVIEDTEGDPRWPESEVGYDDIRSLLVVPLEAKGRIIGVVSLDETRQSHSFTREEVALAQGLASQAAIAIENARLHDNSREMAALEERNRLARDLHDSVTQSLFSLVLNTEVAGTLADRDPKLAKEQIMRLKEIAQDALREMRSLIFELRPPSLESGGLIPALEKHAQTVQRKDGLLAEIHTEGVCALPADVEQNLFRIVQEALANVAKHSGAKQAQVFLRCDENGVELTVQDDGRGFDPATASEGKLSLGLTSMKERAVAISGRLEIESKIGEGTRVKVKVPALALSVRKAN